MPDIPTNNVELYLAAIAGEGERLPDFPTNKIERYLAKIAGVSSDVIDIPTNNVELYLAYIAGESVVLPRCPTNVIERYLAYIAGVADVMPPFPTNIVERYLAKIAINGLGTKKTETGTIVHITDALAKAVKSLTVAIEPVQAGAGDPSPSNTRSISGWTGANVMRSGKNLFDKTKVISAYCDGSTKIASNADMKSVYIELAKGVTYTLSNTNAGNFTRYAVCDSIENGSSIYSPTSQDTPGYVNTSVSLLTFTNTKRKYLLCSIYRQSVDSKTFDQIADACQLEIGSTATDYESYQSDTYSFTFPTPPDTVYGGMIDVTTGKLTVNKAIVDLGTLDWNYAPDSLFYSKLGSSQTGYNYSALCSNYKYNTGTAPTDKSWQNNSWIGAKNNIIIMDTAYTDTTAFTSAMSGVQFCYEIEEPIEYTLTPTEVALLLGENNVWADTGDVTVTYLAGE